MRSEDSDFIMEGLSYEDERRIKTPTELTDVVCRFGFLPLFKNHIPGFSVEEMTASSDWWSGDPEKDPWEWRGIVAREGIVSYGKVFAKKAGFLSKEWIPVFANYRRDGYDFDSRYEDGLANQMDKLIYDLLSDGKQMASFELKAQICGKSRKGTGFDTALTRLQMQTYLTVTDFQRKRTKQGEEYGWAATVFATMESVFGENFVRGEYSLEPVESKEKIITHLQHLFPDLSRKDAEKLMK